VKAITRSSPALPSSRVSGETPAKQPVAIWLNLERVNANRKDSDGASRRSRFSSQAGEGRSVWFDENGEALKASHRCSPIQNGRNRARPKTFSTAYGPGAEYSPRDAALFVFLRPTTANHNFAAWCDAAVQRDDGWRPRRARDIAAACACAPSASQEHSSKTFIKKWTCPRAGACGHRARWHRVDPKELGKMSHTMEKEIRRLEKEIWKLAGSEFNVNSRRSSPKFFLTS